MGQSSATLFQLAILFSIIAATLFLLLLNLFVVLILWRFGTCSFQCPFLLLLIEIVFCLFFPEKMSNDGLWFSRSDGCSFVLSSLFHVAECGVGWAGKPKKKKKRDGSFLLPAFDFTASHSVVGEFKEVVKRLQTLVYSCISCMRDPNV